MRVGVLGEPRPEPSRRIAVLGGGVALALALPVFLLAGWSVRGWALGAVLWVAMQAFGALLARVKPSADRLAASGVLAFGMMLRLIALLVVLVAVAASDAQLALAAALVYGLAYTVELALTLVGYYSQQPVT